MVRRVNRAAGAKRTFSYLDHRPYSPDLNPIEKGWSLPKRELATLDNRPRTEDALLAEAQLIWTAVDQDELDNMVDRMEGRLQMVVDGAGYSISY